MKRHALLRAAFGIAALAILAPLACGAPAAVNDAGPDAGICCPIQSPRCDCFYVGGTRDAFGQCMQLCDAPAASLEGTTDENGCPALKSVPYSGRACGAVTDSGAKTVPDASDASGDVNPTDGGSDATVDGDLP